MLCKWLKAVGPLVLLAVACKTPVQSGVQDLGASSGPTGPVYCNFASNFARHETFQLWATMGNHALTGVGYDHVPDATLAASTPTATLGNLSPVDPAVVTNNATRGLRTTYKNLAHIDLTEYLCYQLEGQTAPPVSFFCLSNLPASDSGLLVGLVATNRTMTRYAKDLTLFATYCSTGGS